MNLRRAVMPFLCGMFRYLGCGRSIFGSCFKFRSYDFSTTIKEEEKKFCVNFCPFPSVCGMPEAVIESFSAKIRPSIVYVSREKEIGGSGIILDSKGTILTRTDNVWPLDGRTKINVSLQDGRKFSGTLLEADKGHGLALLKIRSKIPLPITTFGSLENCKHAIGLMSIEHPLRRVLYPRSSSQNEVDEEGNSCLTYEKSLEYLHENYYKGGCGGPIVNFHGEIVGISTCIDIIRKRGDRVWDGAIEAMSIEEALRKVGYVKDG